MTNKEREQMFREWSDTFDTILKSILPVIDSMSDKYHIPAITIFLAFATYVEELSNESLKKFAEMKMTNTDSEE